MNLFARVKKKVVNYLFDHPRQKLVARHTYYIIITVLSAFIFSFGFKCFIQPNYSVLPAYIAGTSGTADATNAYLQSTLVTLPSVSASGTSQVIGKIFGLCGLEWIKNNPTNTEILFWVFYAVINVPLLIFAWFKIGKRFTVYTLLNVIAVSVFGIILPNSSSSDLINQVANYVFEQPVARILFGALTTGVAASLAYQIDTSTGGVDVIAFYFGEKKSKQIGVYSASFNVVVALVYCFVSTFSGGNIYPSGADVEGISGAVTAIAPSLAIVMFFYTGFYMVFNSVVVNTINVFNKKECVEIITSNENLSQAIMANLPHGCTIIEGKGGYSGDKKYLIYMTVRKKEAKVVINVCKKADPNCFINEFPLSQVYGKFFRKPIE